MDDPSALPAMTGALSSSLKGFFIRLSSQLNISCKSSGSSRFRNAAYNASQALSKAECSAGSVLITESILDDQTRITIFLCKHKVSHGTVFCTSYGCDYQGGSPLHSLLHDPLSLSLKARMQMGR